MPLPLVPRGEACSSRSAFLVSPLFRLGYSCELALSLAVTWARPGYAMLQVRPTRRGPCSPAHTQLYTFFLQYHDAPEELAFDLFVSTPAIGKGEVHTERPEIAAVTSHRAVRPETRMPVPGSGMHPVLLRIWMVHHVLHPQIFRLSVRRFFVEFHQNSSMMKTVFSSQPVSCRLIKWVGL